VSFVMGSDVMMTVARGFESPMKILFKNKEGASMLGIGDIIIPGLLVSMCLRIDFVRGLLMRSLQKKRELMRSQSRDDVVNELSEQASVIDASARTALSVLLLRLLHRVQSGTNRLRPSLIAHQEAIAGPPVHLPSYGYRVPLPSLFEA